MNVWIYKASDGGIRKGKVEKMRGLKNLAEFIDNLDITGEKVVIITTVKDFIKSNEWDEEILKKSRDLGLDKCVLIIEIYDDYVG